MVMRRGEEKYRCTNQLQEGARPFPSIVSPLHPPDHPQRTPAPASPAPLPVPAAGLAQRQLAAGAVGAQALILLLAHGLCFQCHLYMVQKQAQVQRGGHQVHIWVTADILLFNLT